MDNGLWWIYFVMCFQYILSITASPSTRIQHGDQDVCKITFQGTNGKTCFKCSRGHFRTGDCVEDGEQARCAPCPHGQFQPNCSIATSCQNCSPHCLHKFMVVIKECSGYSNLECACQIGRHWVPDAYSKDEGVCLQHTQCKRGYGLEEFGTPHQDTTCVPCSPGHTFSTESSFLECKPCTKCSRYKRSCTATVDAICDTSVITHSATSETTTARSGEKGSGLSDAIIVCIALVVCAGVIGLLFITIYFGNTIYQPKNNANLPATRWIQLNSIMDRYRGRDVRRTSETNNSRTESTNATNAEQEPFINGRNEERPTMNNISQDCGENAAIARRSTGVDIPFETEGDESTPTVTDEHKETDSMGKTVDKENEGFACTVPIDSIDKRLHSANVVQFCQKYMATHQVQGQRESNPTADRLESTPPWPNNNNGSGCVARNTNIKTANNQRANAKDQRGATVHNVDNEVPESEVEAKPLEKPLINGTLPTGSREESSMPIDDVSKVNTFGIPSGEQASIDWRTIYKFLAERSPYDFKMFFRELVEHKDVEAWMNTVREDIPNRTMEQNYQLMLKWKEVFPEGTVGNIIEALERVALNGIAQSLKELLDKNNRIIT